MSLIIIEEIIIVLLLMATLVNIITNRLRIPYTVGLVLFGLLVSIFRQTPPQPVNPDLILAALVPPLVFEGAFHLEFSDLRRNLGLITALAVPGVIITTVLVGGLVAWGAQISLATALVFGSIVAATDPVSVIALFRSLGVPKRLQVLLEGESLFNDGTAIVVFRLMMGIALTGSFSLSSSLLNFITIAGGGLLIGATMGMLTAQLIRYINNPPIETTMTTILAFGSYIVAEQIFHVSGVLAVVAAGLATGNVGPRGMSPTTRMVIFNFWEYAAFLANSFVFLLIGLEIYPTLLIENRVAILWAIFAVLAARLVSIYGLSWLGREMPTKWKHILYWGGLRGAISLALVLSLARDFPNREQLQAMTFGIVLFTLLVQGLTSGPLIKHLGLVQTSEMQSEYERRHARIITLRAAHDRLKRMNQEGLLSDYNWQRISPLLEKRLQALTNAAHEILDADTELQQRELEQAWLETLRTQRTTLNDLFRSNVISEETYTQLALEIDTALDEPRNIWGGLLHKSPLKHTNVNVLIAAVVQAMDAENAIHAIEQLGLSVAQLPSQGVYLGKRNVTLLIGLERGQEEAAIKVLESSCRQRVFYLTSPIADTTLPMVHATPITVGGATIFTFDVERFELF